MHVSFGSKKSRQALKPVKQAEKAYLDYIKALGLTPTSNSGYSGGYSDSVFIELDEKHKSATQLSALLTLADYTNTVQVRDHKWKNYQTQFDKRKLEQLWKNMQNARQEFFRQFGSKPDSK